MTEVELDVVVSELQATLADTIEKLSAARERPPRLLKENEAARYMGISGRTLRDWRDKGIGPDYLKLEGGEKTIRYDILTLDQYISEHPRRKETQ